jgi:hypothetical protein
MTLKNFCIKLTKISFMMANSPKQSRSDVLTKEFSTFLIGTAWGYNSFFLIQINKKRLQDRG